MKPVLLILSDLWGKEKSEWTQFYTSHLSSIYTIKYYDSCELASVDKSIDREEKLHTQFVNGGIEKAVDSLVAQGHKHVDVLAFSVGGVIAWKAALSGLNINALFAVSSTRLRKETEKPNCHIQLFYGEDDPSKPEQTWYEQLELEEFIFPNSPHEMYRDKEVAKKICQEILAYNKKGEKLY